MSAHKTKSSYPGVDPEGVKSGNKIRLCKYSYMEKGVTLLLCTVAYYPKGM